LLADYGESRFFSKASQTKTKSKMIGTYMYMAPELISEEEGFILLMLTIIITFLGNVFSLGKSMDLNVIGGH
jgi:serine/threonine protein kinase